MTGLLTEAFKNLPAELTEQIRERIEIYQLSFADNTNRARSADYKVFAVWCKTNLPEGIQPIPCEPETIERFLWSMAEKPKVDDKTGEPVYKKVKGSDTPVQVMEAYKSTNTLSRYVATLKYMHDVAIESARDVTKNYQFGRELQNPAQTKRVTMTLKAIRKKFLGKTRQRQAAPMKYVMLENIVANLDDSLRDKLYKALISFAFDSMMRCSELVRVELSDIHYDPELGSAEVFVPFHKADQEGEGGYRYLSQRTVDYLNEWLDSAGIDSGLVFRSVDVKNHILPSMHKDRIARIFKNLAKKSGYLYKDISAHSTRVGAAQELLLDGATLPQLMVVGDWKSPAMPVRYAKRIDAKKGAMAEYHKHRKLRKSENDSIE